MLSKTTEEPRPMMPFTTLIRPIRRPAARLSFLGLLLLISVSRTFAEEVATTETPLSTYPDKTPASAIQHSLHYYGILYGPSVRDFSAHQSDPTLPITTRNFLTWNMDLGNDTILGVTGSWSWQPVLGQDLALRDPFLKLGKANLIRTGSFSWYGDFRVHLPVTEISRAQDLWFGLQSFHYLSWEGSKGGLGAALSTRYNQYGGQGFGDNWDVYLGPSAHVNLHEKLSFQLLLEWGAGHPVEESRNILFSNGVDLEPGLTWRALPNLDVNPYVTIPLDNEARTFGTDPSLGMSLSWQLL
jgi:hypothetical protein